MMQSVEVECEGRASEIVDREMIRLIALMLLDEIVIDSEEES
jgi:hypothetical protein